MKKFTTAFFAVIFLAATISQVKAQDIKPALTGAFKSLESASDMGGMMTANNKFSLIAAKWSDNWAANYYAAFSNAFISLKEPDAKRKDQLLDAAEKYLDKTNSINAASDESMVLTAYVAYARFLIDPPNRWKKYLDLMNSNLDNAKKTNPNNPRIYYLQGIPLFARPKTYGGGKDVAKPYFEKAKTLFAAQNATDITKPFWGEKENASYLAQCNE
jgi:hypothetical protein